MIVLFAVIVPPGSPSETLETCTEAGKVNPLVRGGTSQLDRYLAQLQPDYISVNEKNQAQWLTFTANMAECLNYYNSQNAIDGDWSVFFNQDLVNYARLSLEDTSAIQTYFADLLGILQSDELAYTPAQRCDAFNTICLSIFTLSLFIDGQLSSTTAGSDYNNRLVDLVTNKLRQPLGRLLGYFKGANQNFLGGAISTVFPPILLFGTDVISDPAVFSQALTSSLWFSPYPNGTTYYNNISADTSIFGNLPVNTNDPPYSALAWRCFLRASRHNLFTSIINTYIYACSYIQQLNAQSFNTTLSTGQLPPHLCLYFAFLNMLEQAQTDLNQFTERHLNFFYESVLQLAPLPAQPNQAHVTVQIAKNMPEYLIPAGALFNAGKDDSGANVSYSLLQDTVFNQATVAALKSFYVAGQSDQLDDNNTTLGITNNDKAFASPIANSADGIGGDITDTPPAWQAFGNKSLSNTGDVTMLMPLADIGFAIASQYLYLQEGLRAITIQLYTGNAALFGQVGNVSAVPFSCQLTTPGTKTGWTAVDSPVNPKVYSGYIEFDIILDPKFPSVGGYSAKLNGPAIQTDLPLIQFTLIDNDFGRNGYFAGLQLAQFTQCVISITVGTTNPDPDTLGASSLNGLKTLYLSNDGGPIDASQPFNPFGNPAKTNGYINIGCRELFMKPGAKYLILVEHTGIPDYSNPPSNTKTSTHYPTWYQGSALWFVDVSALVPTSPPAMGTLLSASGIVNNPPELLQGYLSDGVWTDNTGTGAYYPYPFASSYPSLPGTTFNPFAIITGNTINQGNYLLTLPSDSVIGYEDNYTPYSQASTDGFTRIKLTTDFGYNQYAEALVQYRIEQSPISTTPTAEFEPVTPYSPLIKTISLNYTVTATIQFGANTYPNNAAPFIHYFYIYPFGAAELTCPVPALTALTDGGSLQLTNLSQYQPLTAEPGATVQVPIGNIEWNTNNAGDPLPAYPNPWPPYIFPAFSGIVSANTQLLSFISEFYIGLSNISPGQNVNLLFEVLDGSTNPLQGTPQNQQIYWFYLSNNQWLSFENSIIDNTALLTQSGIITFPIPLDATLQNTLLPAGYLWLKAGLIGYPDTVCELINVMPQAALVQFVNNNNSPDFLQNQIPAGTINKLVKPLAPVKKIVQPFQSFGGKTAESVPAFRVRVSERLRHKDRAIQIWDYEHLILQQFTTIQKVKCLNHTEYNPGANDGILYSEQAPGHVTIVTIPYVNKSNSANLLKPYTSVNILNAITDFIKTRISAQVALHVENPLFEEIQMDFSVQFMPGLDLTYYTNLLNQAILQFLSPWAFTDEADISFGGVIYKSTIINFIESQSYVNYCTDVYMYSSADNPQVDLDTAVASNSISILVSAAVHTITAIPYN